jgi:NAD(P)-dependent dehydrogenase (short-subunit alcohol dehydrogenase family)
MEEYVAANPIWIPAGRVGTPEDVASAMVFLADNSQSSYIVGQSIAICGGASICMGLDTSDYKTPLLG